MEASKRRKTRQAAPSPELEPLIPKPTNNTSTNATSPDATSPDATSPDATSPKPKSSRDASSKSSTSKPESSRNAASKSSSSRVKYWNRTVTHAQHEAYYVNKKLYDIGKLHSELENLRKTEKKPKDQSLHGYEYYYYRLLGTATEKHALDKALGLPIDLRNIEVTARKIRDILEEHSGKGTPTTLKKHCNQSLIVVEAILRQEKRAAEAKGLYPKEYTTNKDRECIVI